MGPTRREMLALMAGLGLAGCARSDDRPKIGFIVKQPEEQWFQSEWFHADRAGAEHGFTVIKIGAPDGDRVLSAIDSLAAKNALGFVICTPDPKLGPAIRQSAAMWDLKVMSVDDRLIGPDGEPIESIPHVGISALNIGTMAGQVIAREAAGRGWDLASGEVGLLRLAFDSLQTGLERTQGGRDALIAAGLPASAVYDAPQRTTDTEGGFTAANPVLTRMGTIRKWAIIGMNDEAVLGGVRAAEGLGLSRADIIGVGIGGSGSATAEFSKANPTGFFASILLSPKRHGYDTALAMYRWGSAGEVPAPLVYTDGLEMNRGNWQALLAEQNA